MSDRYVLISTDSHAGPTAERYREYVDPRYRGAFDEAAREAEELAKLRDSDEHRKFLAEWDSEIGQHGGMKGAYDPAVRDKEMDHDGVAAEVIFPDADAAGVGGVSRTPFTAGLGSTGTSDPELTLAGAWAHNRWLAEFCTHSPERRAGVAIVPMHDVGQAVRLIEWAAGQNLHGGIMIPTKWVGLPSYNDPVYDPVWATAAEAGLPVHTHSGVGPDEADYGFTPGLIAIYTTEAYWWAARPLWCLILGGVFERHPNLKYVLAENGAWWVPDIIARMDSKWEGDHATRKFGPSVFRSGLTMKPGDYVDRSVFFAASVMGRAEIDRRHQIGVDNLMWGSDYPHPEGTWPHTRPWLAERFSGVPRDETRRILGRTAAQLGKNAAGEVRGIAVDVTDPASVEGLAAAVFERFGAVHVLINNAGVGAPSAKPWETTPNDWRWVHSVNVFGVAHGIQAFVPRMIASGEPGYVVNTSSADGAINPLPGASVYAASKAAVATLTECLATQLAADGARIGVALFLPGGGLLDTGLWTADRNRPAELARERPRANPAMTVSQLVDAAAASGRQLPVQSLDVLAGQVAEGIRAGVYCITCDIAADTATLRERADRLEAGQCPTLAGAHGILT